MILPKELEKQKFSRTVSGYSIPEVDEYVSYLSKAYMDLFREYDSIQQKLDDTKKQLDALRAEETEIRVALVTAQKVSKKIIESAKTTAEKKLEQANQNCSLVLEKFNAEQAQAQVTLENTRDQIEKLKNRLLVLYSTHIPAVRQIAPDAVSELAEIAGTDADADITELPLTLSQTDADDSNDSITDDELIRLSKRALTEADSLVECSSEAIEVPETVVTVQDVADRTDAVQEEQQPLDLFTELPGEKSTPDVSPVVEEIETIEGESPQSLLMALKKDLEMQSRAEGIKAQNPVQDNNRRVSSAKESSGDDDINETLRLLNNKFREEHNDDLVMALFDEVPQVQEEKTYGKKSSATDDFFESLAKESSDEEMLSELYRRYNDDLKKTIGNPQ